MALDSSAVAPPRSAGAEAAAAALRASSIDQEVLCPSTFKRRRNPPGMPDPDAEVVALTAEALTATNRFVCEICGKGFPRDQNLQLHRREHNLPWNLRGSGKRQRKRVYICPVSTCVYHDASRALGDLTGIKKHFFRKHGGEKKYGCGSCSKNYAVLSDWQTHVRSCGGATDKGDSAVAIAINRRKHKKLSVEQPTTPISNSASTDEPEKTPSLPVITPVFQLEQQLPVAPATPEHQQQQGQLVLAGYLLFYDCNLQAQSSLQFSK